MREIKFRGKRVNNGEWVYGYFYSYVRDDNRKPEHCILQDISSLASDFKINYVDPSTVGQYTGRTAQCTDAIYEGDRCIVTIFDHNGTDYQHECEVVWDNGCLAFSNEAHEFWMPVAYVEDTDSDVEVIGNIHDNPELIKAGVLHGNS